jgi:hypothetical protein
MNNKVNLYPRKQPKTHIILDIKIFLLMAALIMCFIAYAVMTTMPKLSL